MGACIVVTPMIVSIELLGVALTELDLVLREIKDLREERRKLEGAEHAFRTQSGELVGVRKTKAGPLEFVVSNAHGIDVEQTLDRVKQAYARVKVLDEAKRKGYRSVKEEKCPDGTIKLVVERWQ